MRSIQLCLLVSAVALSPSASAGIFEVTSKSHADALRTRIKAARFLDCATFGATKADIESLALRMNQVGHNRAMREWIDEQFELPPTLVEPIALQMIADDGLALTDADGGMPRYRHQAFWHVALTAPDQLRQRLAFALSQICVINDSMFSSRRVDESGKPRYLAPLNYYDMLVRNSTGPYRDLLFDVTLHPCMGRFLSHRRNQKADEAGTRFPDENYAREIMQLFTIGLYELNQNGTCKLQDGLQIPTYGQKDIRELARVFTGLTDVSEGFTGEGNWFVPMSMYEPEHDSLAKQLLNGLELPAEQDGLTDIRMAIDNLVSHPSAAPFVSRLLIQRLAKSNPSRAYTLRIARVFSSSEGSLKEVVKAILTDREFNNALVFKTIKRAPGDWTLEVLNDGTKDSRFVEPMVRYASFLRKFHATPDNVNGWYSLTSLESTWSQAFLKAPSVFNFYSPDYQPPGVLTNTDAPRSIPNGFYSAPEFEIYTPIAANRTANRFRIDVYKERADHRLLRTKQYKFINRLTLNFDEEKSLAPNPQALVDHLDVLLAHGNLSEALRQNLVAALQEETTDATERAHAAILCVLLAPGTAITW